MPKVKTAIVTGVKTRGVFDRLLSEFSKRRWNFPELEEQKAEVDSEMMRISFVLVLTSRPFISFRTALSVTLSYLLPVLV